MLRIRALRKSVGPPSARRTLFEGLDLDVSAGEIVALMGESGSGKSTFLNTVAGLDVPDAGTVEIDGCELARLDDTGRSHFRRHHLGFVFQAFHLLPYLTVEDNVALPLIITAHTAEQRKFRVARALADVGLTHRAAAYPRDISGGEMQRAAIARALIHAPKLLLADEPTGNLDADNAARVLALIREQVAQARVACLLVTHSAAAARTAHRAYVLSGGALHAMGEAG